MSAAAATLDPKIRECVDSYLLQNGYHDMFMKELAINKAVSEQFKASLTQLELVSAHIATRLAERRASEQKSQELWFKK